MNLYKVKVSSDEGTGIIFVGCNSINEIESTLIEKRVRYHEVTETTLIADNLIVRQEDEKE